MTIPTISPGEIVSVGWVAWSATWEAMVERASDKADSALPGYALNQLNSLAVVLLLPRTNVVEVKQAVSIDKINRY